TSAFQVVQCFPFTFRRCPSFLVNTRSVLTLIFCHSSNSKGFAAQRVGQQMLQSFYFAPPTFLCRLHDTQLQPMHVFINSLPVDTVPAINAVGNRTSRFNSSYRHFLCFLYRFYKLSRDERPARSQPAFASSDVATHIPLITRRRSLALASFTRIAIRKS